MIIAFISLAEEKPIGILHESRVYCNSCSERFSLKGKDINGNKGINIYRTNIYPYKQDCACCGETLVKGQTELWPELFA